MTLVDANVLLDLLGEDQVWADWSARQLRAAASRGRILTNPVVYAEISVGFGRIEDLDQFLERIEVNVAPIPGPDCSSPARRIAAIARAVALAPACCRTSSSGRTQRSPACRC